jgi:transcriptional regulator GlxA family with amidase domain
MKRTLFMLLLVVSLVLALWISQHPVSAERSNNVLLMLREHAGSTDKQYMDTNEPVVIKRMLEEAGLTVVIASASGRTFQHISEEITLESDVTLADVTIADYVGCIIPCMALQGSIVKPEEVALAKHIVAAGKPVAAQDKGVVILAEAGVLVGKRYSHALNRSFDKRFKEAIYSGNGVVQDGKIITSAYCPGKGSDRDQTVELTQALIAELQQ